MEKRSFSVDSGIVEFEVNDKRSIYFNPSDHGFLNRLYDTTENLSKIMTTAKEEMKKATGAALFEISRKEDADLRAEVDGLLGEGFCQDVFGDVRLSAISDGLTIVENLLYAIIDEMDSSLTENMKRRDARVRKYTDKYAKKYHR